MSCREWAHRGHRTTWQRSTNGRRSRAAPRTTPPRTIRSNSRQVTDANGVPIPALAPPGGFPAFSRWADGCAATVAALLQPSMTPIVIALRAGDISVPGVFLADVDQTPWCAPSADGIPCYANEILAGELVNTLVNGLAGQLKSSLTSYSQTGVDLRSYEDDAVVTAANQGLVAAKSEQLVSSEQQVSEAQRTLSKATLALRRIALDDYTTDAASRFDSSLPFFGPPNELDAVAEYFRSTAASLVTLHHDQAKAAFKIAVSKRQAADASVARATASLISAAAAESQALAGLEADVTSIETDLACAPPLVTAAASPVASPSSVGQLWETLQGCLTHSAQVAGPPASTASS